MNSMVLVIITYLMAVMVAVSVRELARAFTSSRLGDDTAKLYGRASLNLLRYVDPFMTVILPIMLALSGAPVFGSAKPALVNKRKLKYGDWGVALVAMSGLLSNLLASFVFYGLAAWFTKLESTALVNVAMAFVMVNLGFFAFNMLPIVPLDGSKLLYAFAPSQVQDFMDRLDRYGSWIILAIVLLLQTYLFLYVSTVSRFLMNLFSGVFVV